MAVPPVPARESLKLDELSRSQRKAVLKTQRAKLLARDVIRASNELWCSGAVPPDHRRIDEEAWDRPAVARILEDCRDFDASMTAARVSTPNGHESLCRLAKVSSGGYGFHGAKEEDISRSTGSSVSRGEVVPAQIDCIDLPDASGGCSLRLSDLPELAAEMPSGHAADLLLPLHEGTAVRGYADPALRSGVELNTLAAMMLMCGLVTPTARAVPFGIKL